MTLRNKFALGLAFAALTFTFYKGCEMGKQRAPGISHSPILPLDDKEQILVNPIKHTLTIVTSSGPKTVTLPDRVSTIDIRKDGSVNVTAPQFGFETRPFIGLGFGSGLRGYAGADLVYYKKLDLALGGITPRLNKPELTDTRAGVFVSYSVYDNTRFTVGYDTSRTVHALVSVRL